MTLSTQACRLAEATEAGIASVWAIIAYAAASTLAHILMSADLVTVLLSHFANVALILMAIASKRRQALLERQVDALAKANPDVDDAAIEREAG